MDDREVLKFVLPENRAVSLRITVFAIALVGLGFMTMGFVWMSQQIFQFGAIGSELIYLLCIIAVLGAATNGYVNDDFTVSVCIAVAPLVGFILFAGSTMLVTDFAPLTGIGWIATKVGIGAAVVGAVVSAMGVWAGRRFGGGRSSPNLE